MGWQLGGRDGGSTVLQSLGMVALGYMQLYEPNGTVAWTQKFKSSHMPSEIYLTVITGTLMLAPFSASTSTL